MAIHFPTLKKDSIQTQLLAAILVIYLVLSFITATIHTYFAKNDAQGRILQQINSLQNVSQEIFALSLWEIDKQRLQTQIDGLLESPVIVGVKIVGKYNDFPGELIIRKGSVADSSGNSLRYDSFASKGIPADSRLFGKNFTVFNPLHHDQKIGTVFLYSDEDVLAQMMNFGFFSLFLIHFSEIAVLSICFLALFHTMLTRPLVHMAAAVRNARFDTDSPRHMHVSLPLQNELSVLQSAYNSIIDDIQEKIVALRASEAALRSSEKMFRNVVENMPILIHAHDENGNIAYWNRASERALGWKSREVVGNRHITTSLYPKKETRRKVETLSRPSPSPVTVEVQVATSNNETRIIQWTNASTFARIPGWSWWAVGVDVTERSRAEQAIARAKDEAEKANHSKTIFLANMSHELRTPLNGIIGMQELLQTTSLDDEQKEYLELAILSSRRLTNLLGDILDLTKIGTGNMKIVEKSFNLAESLSYLEHLFGPPCTQKGLQLYIEMDDAVPRNLLGDPFRLQQVLNNLVGNGIKFTRTGDITCRVSLLPDNGPDRIRILFEISDTGIGMEKDKIPMLFQAFTQADEGHQRAYEGAGLGLSIVSQLITLMGGDISVSSEPGVGSTFRVVLPFKPAQEIPVKKPVNTSLPARKSTGVSILLVEDEPVNRIAAKTLLEKAGHTVVTEEDGKKAVHTLQTGHYDLVLMDIQMPVMDGLEATRAIRAGKAGEANKEIPIVALTAYVMEGNRSTFLQAGMNAHLAKPISMKELQAALSTLLE